MRVTDTDKTAVEADAWMDAAEILDALVAGRFLGREKIVEVLASSGGEPSSLLGLFRGEGVALEGVGDLLKAIHLLYLRSQDTWFLHLSMLLYAAENGGSGDAVQLFLSGRMEEALALAAYTARLRVEKPSVEPWRDPGAWVRALRASYYLDVGVKVIREILSRYNFREHFGERACSHSCDNTAEQQAGRRVQLTASAVNR